MIEYKSGDIFDADTEAIVNTVNCVGVMGRGLALQFKNRFPDNFAAYESLCKRKAVMPGKMFVYETNDMINHKYIINFPTKRHWRGVSRIEDIESGLIDLVKVIKDKNITSIAIPPLGSGLGGLDWNLVKSKMDIILRTLSDVRIDIYQPAGAPHAEKMVHNRKIPKMTQGRAALVGLIKHYLDGLLDPFITLLEVHKLLYFLQISGEELRLNYVKAQHGPYAENLRHVLNAVEGHLLFGFADWGDNPQKQLKIVPGAEEEVTDFLEQHRDTCNRMKRVEELVSGYETSFGLELLSTVHWIVQKENVSSLKEVIEHTYAWNESKKQFSPRQIELALVRLKENNWFSTIE
ncbi:MAG: macro domain-containing protein [Victivallales bacterium]|jgi:O-acetyl-ADP-ribose deacetylase (regulator of RNase III)|nr:macro domain-containing protein [Victivallales bacterium]